MPSDRFDEIEHRFEELNRELSSPEVASDLSRLRDLGKQHAELEEIVRTHRAMDEAGRQAAEWRDMAKEEKDRDLAAELRSEAVAAEQRAADLKAQFEALMIPKDPNDEKDVLVEIRAGTGGQEAALFAGEIYEMYQRYAEAQRWKVEVLSSSPSEVGGFKEVVLEVRGKGAYSRMKHESGVHRVQRIPVTESGGRIHTSTVTVAVLPEAEEVDVQIDPNDLEIQVYRSSGPGGQSVNTTDSAVRIIHKPSGIKVEVQEERSQLQNREKGMRYLRARLLQAAQDEAQAKESAARREQVGTGERSEKIRTYNFPQNRVTDHRLGMSLHNLPAVMAGDLSEFIDALMSKERAEKLSGSGGEG
jgi:peptide chain release factor 1